MDCLENQSCAGISLLSNLFSDMYYVVEKGVASWFGLGIEEFIPL